MGEYLFARAKCLLAGKKGQGMVEYAILVVVVVGIAYALKTGGLGDAVSSAFTAIKTAITSKGA